MEYRAIPHTDLKVSVIGLGTMTFGEQNTEAEGHAQLDRALEAGVNLIDTAEMYPVPPRQETYGETERIIGTWLKARKCRDKVVLASKIAGREARAPYIRDGSRFNRDHIFRAIDDSLQRLQTDYLDLYQLHWPERDTTFFGTRTYPFSEKDFGIPFEETLDALGEIIRTGKVRYIGVSNETPWGVMTFLKLAEQRDLPRIVTIQNPFSLLNRTFEEGLSEVTHREGIPLLAYSPLAFGKLSGKYRNGAKPEGARLTLFERFQRYDTPSADPAIDAYAEIAQRHGLDLAQMSLAFINAKPFVASNLIGATTMEQLESNLAGADLQLDDEVVCEIDAVHDRLPDPCP